MVKRRNRTKHTKTFEERLAEEAARFKEAAAQLPPGTQRELYLKRARQAETASHINEWLTSPGLQPPTALDNMQVGRPAKRDRVASD
ncbi:hypothetical protein [Bradyrhizobium sp. 613_E4_N2_2]|uniref:hypothetical protein n=1 Tax=unclassified Bradyrhizobium TaxID=2631580 RepID=UPI003F8BB4B5